MKNPFRLALLEQREHWRPTINHTITEVCVWLSFTISGNIKAKCPSAESSAVCESLLLHSAKCSMLFFCSQLPFLFSPWLVWPVAHLPPRCVALRMTVFFLFLRSGSLCSDIPASSTTTCKFLKMFWLQLCQCVPPDPLGLVQLLQSSARCPPASRPFLATFFTK